MSVEAVEKLDVARLPTAPRRIVFIGGAALALGVIVLVGQHWVISRTNDNGIGASGSGSLDASSQGMDLMEMWAATGTQAPVRIGGRVEQASAAAQGLTGPYVARNIHVSLRVADLDAFRATVESFVKEVNGSIASVTTYQDPNEPRMLTALLHVPSTEGDVALGRLRTLGKVIAEEQEATDLTARVVDQDARVRNMRTSEARLRMLLETRTGTLADVLAAERELTRVSGELETMEATRRLLSQQTTFARLKLEAREEHTAVLNVGTVSIKRRLRNAAVDGWSIASRAAIGLVLLAVWLGPTVLLGGLVFLPIWRLARAVRRRELSAR